MENDNHEKKPDEPLDNLISHIEKVEKKLQFDPASQQLIVSEKQKEGAIVVDQIYKDGFFCKQVA